MSDARCVDRLIVEAVVGIQIEPARASQGAAGSGQTERPKPFQFCNGTASDTGDTRAAQRSSMSDARCIDRLIVEAVVGIQIEPATASQDAAGLGRTERPKPLQFGNGTAAAMGDTRAA